MLMMCNLGRFLNAYNVQYLIYVFVSQFICWVQMVLYLGEASRQFGCTEIFKEPSKFALSDYYEEHFTVPHQKIVLVTNKRVMLLQVSPKTHHRDF